jgi:hypothetical protein
MHLVLLIMISIMTPQWRIHQLELTIEREEKACAEAALFLSISLSHERKYEESEAAYQKYVHYRDIMYQGQAHRLHFEWQQFPITHSIGGGKP